MTQKHKPFDPQFAIGDIVLIKRIPESLLRGLPGEDQEAINRCVGQRFSISGFDPCGHAEIEFIDAQGNFHTIWIQTDCLEKLG